MNNIENIFYNIYGDIYYKNKNLDDICLSNITSSKNMDRKLLNEETDTIVFSLQEEDNEYLKSLLVYNFMGLFVHISKKYVTLLPHAIKNTKRIDILAEDLIQDCIIILTKCINKYRLVENGTFKAYMYGEIRNNIIDNMLKKYFSVVMIPVSVYRNFRKNTVVTNEDNINDDVTNNNFKTNDHYGMYSKVDSEEFNLENICSELKSSDSELDYKEIELLTRLKKEINDDEKFRMFCLINGLGCEKVKSIDVCEMFNIKPSALSHRMRNLRNKLISSNLAKELIEYQSI